MISNRCARKSLVTNCNSIISKNYLRFLVDSNDKKNKIMKEEKIETAIFAGGCFWGMEYMMRRIKGVVSVMPGYIGGHKENPSYQEVKAHTTGHVEAVRILFHPDEVDFEVLARYFFEIHDPTQTDGQGPDIGPQYLSAIFYTTPQQKDVSERLIEILKDKGYDVVTRLLPATEFWTAEEYHQNYYEKTGEEPYCHIYKKRF